MKVIFMGNCPNPNTIGNIVQQSYSCKPRSGGLWTCPLDPECASAWWKWCLDENFDHHSLHGSVWGLQVLPSAKIYKIHTHDDLIWLQSQYPLQNRVDYSAVARDYDGIWLTNDGQWATRLPEKGPDLYGWDCECVLFFRNVFYRKLLLEESGWNINKNPKRAYQQWSRRLDQ